MNNNINIRTQFLNIIQLYDMVLKQSPIDEDDTELNIWVSEFVQILQVKLLSIVQKRLCVLGITKPTGVPKELNS